MCVSALFMFLLILSFNAQWFLKEWLRSIGIYLIQSNEYVRTPELNATVWKTLFVVDEMVSGRADLPFDIGYCIGIQYVEMEF